MEEIKCYNCGKIINDDDLASCTQERIYDWDGSAREDVMIHDDCSLYERSIYKRAIEFIFSYDFILGFEIGLVIGIFIYFMFY